MNGRPRLRALAARLGVADGYRSALDEGWVETSDATRESLVSALGHACSDEAAAAASLDALEAESARRPLAREGVVHLGGGEPRVALAWPAEAPDRVRFELALEPDPSAGETGGDPPSTREGWLERGGALALPGLPGPGIHRLQLRLAWEGGGAEAAQRLFAVPDRCVDVEERVGPSGAFGLWTHLYVLRSRSNWGFGNLGDLEGLVDWAAEIGAAFVGVNPLHALASSPRSPCPYLPQSRLYREPLYLVPEAVPEWSSCEEARRIAASRAADIERLRGAPRLDVGAVADLLRPVLGALHREFVRSHRGRDGDRGRRYARYLEEQGDALTDFCTFRALEEQLAGEGRGGDWRGWPEPLRDARGEAVARFRETHALAIDFHAWVQFELDRQLARAAGHARDRGLPIGLYTDLALGSHPGGSDVWSHADLFARGVSVGAPPDAFSSNGQDWSFPPLAPSRLCNGGYGLWWRLLDGALGHAGALRLDHALGLRRLFWIPEGAPPTQGAYVHYPEADLLGLLALASLRHDALVIGEDLGTIPEGFSEALQERGVLSSRVLLFERDRDGFRPARSLPRRCLLTANTHDLPPLAALAGDEDLALRRRTGQLPDEAALSRATEERRADRLALARRLREQGGFEGEIEPGPARTAALVAATTRFLCASPAALVGLALDDLVGEREPLNLPGVPHERHPSWTRRARVAVEALAEHPVAREAVAAVPEARRSGGPPRTRPR